MANRSAGKGPTRQQGDPSGSEGTSVAKLAPGAVSVDSRANGLEAAAVWVERSTLAPWKDNPRKNQKAIAKVAASIKRFGFGAPILARTGGEVIAGHTRLLAAESLGLDRVPVRYLDLDPAEAHLLALADNKLGEVAEWDAALLTNILSKYGLEDAALAGFDSAELDKLADELSRSEAANPEADDDAPAVQEEFDSEPGRVYALGPHRLMCGDSTSPQAWATLMDGERARMVWTDPPYGVAYVGKTQDAMEIENDVFDEDGLRSLLCAAFDATLEACEEGASWYVAAPPGPLHLVFANALREREVYRQALIWSKDQFVLGRSDYHYRHEPIFYGWKPGAAHYFVDDRTQDSLLEVARPRRNAEHPTMKPVELVARCIRNSSQKNWIVADAFGGSGTTLMASAQEGRRARLMEIDPRFCDVIRRRWTRYAQDNGIDPGDGRLT